MALQDRDLAAWQRAMELVTCVYRLTDALAREGVFGLRQQTRRVDVSVPSNIAKGQGRASLRCES